MPATRKGGTLPCPLCGEAEACIQLDLSELHSEEACTCTSCGNEFGLDFVRDVIRRWGKVLAWIDSAPTFTDEE